MRLHRFLLGLCLVTVVTAACGDDGKTLDDFLPPLPRPDGTAQTVFAGAITADNAAAELVPGEARSGRIGDYFLRNDKVRFVIQAPTRVMGTVPWGGNLVDAAWTDGSAGDSFGELGLLYFAGRTCAHDTIEIPLDGSGGGPAVIRARGKTEPNDFINIPGIGVFNIPEEILPDVDDGMECATTYVLRPGATHLEVYWTFFNPGDTPIAGPIGTLSDTGGNVETFGPKVGMHLVKSLTGVDKLVNPNASPYQVFQGPDIAYGLVPRHDDPATPNSINNLLGVTIIVFGAESIFDLINEEFWMLKVPAGGGVTHALDFVVGRDAAAVDAFYRERSGQPPTPVTGTVTFMPSGMPGAGARVGVFVDRDGDSAVGPQDEIVTYFDAGADGAFSGALPPGSYLLRADLRDLARSAAVRLDVAGAPATANLSLPDLARFDFTVVDDETGEPIPAKITVVGRSPVVRDARVHLDYDRNFGVVNTFFSAYGTSVPVAPGDPADGAIFLPPGGPYRIFVSRGPEWSYATTQVTPAAGQSATLPTFRLRRTVDTTGYVATEFHLHAINSPDAPVPLDTRVRTLAAEGIEFFASTDHDFISDYEPVIAELGLERVIDSVPGTESTSFVWGHFNAWPLPVDPDHPTGGGIDWADGPMGLDLGPKGVFEAQRQKGAQIVQANHPRARGVAAFMQYFDRVALTFDFASRTFYGNLDALPIQAKVLRLPEDTDLFDPSFDTIEIWTGFSTGDTDRDGWVELTQLDLVMRDWMNFLSLGKVYTPLGNSDSHEFEKNPPGVPRTLIWTGADDAAAVAAGLNEAVTATILGRTASGAEVPRDLVVTNGPMIRVFANGQPTSAIGRVVSPSGGKVTLDIFVESADWIPFDTVEIFVNGTFDPLADEEAPSALPPVACFTSRTSLSPNDLCATAPLGGSRPLSLQSVPLPGGGYRRYEASVTFELDADDVAAVNRPGAQGSDAWVVVRVRGSKAVFPVLVEGALAEANLDAVVAAGDQVALEAALGSRGAPPAAFTFPVFVDFDGGGYRAPFAP